MTRPPFFPFIAWYVALSTLMVGAKYLERDTAGGDGYAYISNILALGLLQPWILQLPSGHKGEGINTPLWFLALSVVNLALLLLVSLAVSWVRSKGSASKSKR